MALVVGEKHFPMLRWFIKSSGRTLPKIWGGERILVHSLYAVNNLLDSSLKSCKPKGFDRDQ